MRLHAGLGRNALALWLGCLGLLCGCGARPPAADPEPDPPIPSPSAFQQALAAKEYEASLTKRGLQAPNRRHNLRTYFSPEGIRVVDRTAEGSPELVALSLASMGRGDAFAEVPPGQVSHEGPRVEIARDEQGIVEWYENGPDGLEQGFTLDRRPAGEGPLELEIAVTGASLSQNEDRIGFHSEAGRNLRFDKLHVEDARGAALPAHFALSDEGFQIVVADAGAHYPIVVDPLLTESFDAELESHQSEAWFGRSVASAGDVNGDGYGDVIVGASDYDAGSTDEGATFIFHGGPGGVHDGSPFSADTILESNQADASFGASVAAAGDVNGDGYSDVIVGAKFYDAGQVDEGAAFIFLGSAQGIADGSPSTAHAQIQSNHGSAFLGGSVASAGDVNRDGYSDVIVGAASYEVEDPSEGAAFVFHGSAAGIADGNPATANSWIKGHGFLTRLGWDVASAGDVDSDGYDDVIVSAETYDNSLGNYGAAFIYHGSAAGIVSFGNHLNADTRLESDQGGNPHSFGRGVASVGDVNGDGYGDVIVGAQEYLGAVLGGAAFVFHGGPAGIADGSPATADAAIESHEVNLNLGFSAASAGDVNGDGYGDVVVGGWGDSGGLDNAGSAFVFLGGSAGIGGGSTAEADVQLHVSQEDAYFGYSVASAGDVDGDGYGDLIVGAPRYDSGQANEGSAFVYHGSSEGIALLASIADTNLTASQAGAFFGGSVSSAGDVNGDGYSDVLVGAYLYDSGETNEGAAFLYLGGSDGIGDLLTSGADAMFESNQAGAQFGRVVASAGDVNGDGRGDIVVGASHYDAGETDEGAAFLFQGTPTGMPSGHPGTAATALYGDQAGAFMGMSVASAGDVNGDGYGDLIVGASHHTNGQSAEGGAFVYLGNPGGIPDGNPSSAHTRLESDDSFARFGGSVASAGDVNGDGYDDVIVGAFLWDDAFLDEGGAFVFHGSAAGVAHATPATAHARLLGGQGSTSFGHSVASAGDVDADGYSDVIVGAPDYTWSLAAKGGAFLFRGGPLGVGDGTPGTADSVLESLQSSSYGASVASAGDVNGDGYGDVIVGDPAATFIFGGAGIATLHFGSAAGVPDGSTVEADTLFFGSAGAGLGVSVASSGDVDGDGFADLLIGAPGLGVGGTALLYHPTGEAVSRRPRQGRSDAFNLTIQPGGLSYYAGAFTVTMTTHHPEGRGSLRLEAEACPAGVPFEHWSCTTELSDLWVSAPSGTAVLTLRFTGLAPGAYNWRARSLRAPSNVALVGATPPVAPDHGPWFRLQGDAVTSDVRALPEPGATTLLLAGAIALAALGQRRVRRARDRA